MLWLWYSVIVNLILFFFLNSVNESFMTLPHYIEPGDYVVQKYAEGICIDVSHNRSDSVPARDWIIRPNGSTCGVKTFSKHGIVKKYSYKTMCQVPPEVVLSRIREGASNFEKCKTDPVRSREDVFSLKTSLMRRSSLTDGRYKIKARGTSMYLSQASSGSLCLVVGPQNASVFTIAVQSSLSYDVTDDNIVQRESGNSVSQFLKECGIHFKQHDKDEIQPSYSVPDKIIISIGNRVVGVPISFPTGTLCNFFIFTTSIALMIVYPPISLGKLLARLVSVVYSSSYLTLSFVEFIRRLFTHTSDILRTVDTSFSINCCFNYQSDGRIIASNYDNWQFSFEMGVDPVLMLSTTRVGNPFDFIPAGGR